MAAAVASVKKDITANLKTKGYYDQKKLNWGYIIVFILVLLPVVFFAFQFLIIGIILGIGVAHVVRLTDMGMEEWAKVQGFKLFLKVTEADRLAFSDAPNKTPELFNKLLPAAVALGVETEWAKQFEGMDLAQSTNGWYTGAPGTIFTPVLLAASLSGDFGTAVSSGFAPISSSSGGGGGFSGGGGGGGGGGSW